MKKIAVIHTTFATIESLKILINQEIKDIEVINILDDSILLDMINNNHVAKVEERWMNYAQIADSLGVDIILSACSTVGEFAEKANEILDIPVIRIDEAMAEKAVEMGNKISVFATLKTTLDPTVKLVKRKAEQEQKKCNINTVLVPSAYEELMKGNKEFHDQLIKETNMKYVETSDVLMLAQASMASAVEGLEASDQKKVLTSPKLGIKMLSRIL